MGDRAGSLRARRFQVPVFHTRTVCPPHVEVGKAEHTTATWNHPMPNTPGATTRQQSPYSSKLASLEPEGDSNALPPALAVFLSTVEGASHG
jgi:hypothetical protein